MIDAAPKYKRWGLPFGGSEGLRRVASWSHMLPSTTRFVHGTEGWRLALALDGRPVIPRGAGRSFGDAAYSGRGGTTCLAASVADARLDEERLILRVDAATAVGAVHDLLEASDYEFPVYGGTQWATVGGAVAGDIHGKNHAAEGSFGCHVAGLSLVTASGALLDCSSEDRSDLFEATIGGMGLTGLIETVELRLRRRRARTIRVERSALLLEDLYRRLDDRRPAFHFSAWFDLAGPAARGLHFEGELSDSPCPAPRRPRRLSTPRLPLVGAGAIRLAGRMVMARSQGVAVRHMHVRDFNYSGLHERLFGWNRLYGRSGMIEYQFVVAENLFPQILAGLIADARRNSVPLLAAVIKRLGDRRSPGLLSFPIEGLTVNFQTPPTAAALDLLSGFSDVVAAAGGRVNLTKDCCVLPGQFARMYDQLGDWQAIVRRYDPQSRIRSAMADRLRLKPW